MNRSTATHPDSDAGSAPADAPAWTKHCACYNARGRTEDTEDCPWRCWMAPSPEQDALKRIAALARREARERRRAALHG